MATHPYINQAHDCLTSVIKHKMFAPCYVSPHTQGSFMKHVNDMCKAPTEEEYMCIFTSLHLIYEECNALQWLQWLDEKKIHLIPTYRCFSIPGLNLAEAGQSTLRENKPNMLIDAVYMDSISMFIQNIRFCALQQNRLYDMGRKPPHTMNAYLKYTLEFCSNILNKQYHIYIEY